MPQTGEPRHGQAGAQPQGQPGTPSPQPRRKLLFVEAGCRKFFKRHAAARARLENQIQESLTQFLDDQPAKIKPASRIRLSGHTVDEARVNSKDVNMRIAFVASGDMVTVVFISSTLQKADFTRELDHFLASGPSLADAKPALSSMDITAHTKAALDPKGRH